MLHPAINQLVQQFLQETDQIDADRKALLAQFAKQLSKFIQAEGKIALNFICTHNSRRSHLAQLWATVACAYFGIEGIETFSGGTEVTALNPRVVTALKALGFQIQQKGASNPHYQIEYGSGQSITAYSKLYDDPQNPAKDFIAVMTCGHADENCPFIPGASWRIALTYIDPKVSDGTPEETMVYRERALQIGREIIYAFSLFG